MDVAEGSAMMKNVTSVPEQRTPIKKELRQRAGKSYRAESGHDPVRPRIALLSVQGDRKGMP